MRTLLCASAVAGAVAIGAASAPAEAGSFNEAEEARVKSLVNKTRASRGVPALAGNAALRKMAREQSARMEGTGGIFHNPSLGPQAVSLGIDWSKLGESVGMGPDADTIQEAFLGSPRHYENIVDPAYNAVGIGVVVTSKGTRFITQVFAKLNVAPPPPDPTPKPAAVAPAPVVTAPAALPASPKVVPTTSAKPPPTPGRVPAARQKPLVRGANAVVGGVVHPAVLEVARGHRRGSLARAVARLVDAIDFWS